MSQTPLTRATDADAQSPPLPLNLMSADSVDSADHDPPPPFTRSSFKSDSDDALLPHQKCACCTADERDTDARHAAIRPKPVRPPLNLVFSQVNDVNADVFRGVLELGEYYALVRSAAQVLVLNLWNGDVLELGDAASVDWTDPIWDDQPVPTSKLPVSFHVLRPNSKEVHIFARTGRYVVGGTFFPDTKMSVTPHVAAVSNLGIAVDDAKGMMIVVDKGWWPRSVTGTTHDVVFVQSVFDDVDGMMAAARALSGALRLSVPVLRNGKQVDCIS